MSVDPSLHVGTCGGNKVETLTKQQLEHTIKMIQDFKQLIKEKGSKDETVHYLMQETQLSKEECEKAFDFYNGVTLP